MKSLVVLGLALFYLVLSQTAAQAPPESQAVAAVQVLWKNCHSCHNDVARKGSLSMHSYETLLRGGKSGPAFIPGKGDESRMVLMMEGALLPTMPQGGFLGDEDIQVIRNWIDAGATPWPADLTAPRLNIPDIHPRVSVQPPVASIAFRPDGKLVAVSGHTEVRLLTPDTRQLVARLEGHADTVRAVAFSPDGTLLAAAGGAPARFGEVKLWELESRKLRHTLQGHDDCIYAAAFSPDGSLLATASYDRLIILWDVATGQEVRKLKDHVDAVFALAFSPDGRHLASASADRTVKIWDPATGQRLLTLSEATEALYALAFHPRGQLVAAGGADKRIRIWRLSAQGGELMRSTFAHDGAILRLGFTPNGETLMSSSADRLLKLWDVESMSEKKVFGPQSDWILALAVSPNGKWVAAGRYDGSLDFYEVDSHGN